MSTACTDKACTEDSAIKKCTESRNTTCYTYLFEYDSTNLVRALISEAHWTKTETVPAWLHDKWIYLHYPALIWPFGSQHHL